MSVTYLTCPLGLDEWRTVDRSHLGWIVLVDGANADGTPNMVRRDAVQAMQDELRGHLAQCHREELQLMLAGIDGGRGEPVVVGLTQHIAAAQMRGAEDLVAATLVPQMRAEMARKLAREGLRPLDPWPAVQVERWVYVAQPFPVSQNGAPGGTRVALADEAPDLYSLTLETEAVKDTREVAL